MTRKQAIVLISILTMVMSLSFFSSVEQCSAESVITAYGRIEFQDIDYTYKRIKLVLHLYEETDTNDPLSHSMTYVIFLESGRYVGFIIGGNDVDWKLVNSNNVNQWNWEIEKTAWVDYNSTENLFLSYPLESFKLSFYIASNQTRGFEISNYIPNLDVVSTSEKLSINEFPQFWQDLRDAPLTSKINVSIYQDIPSRSIAGMLYVVYLVFIILLAILFLRGRRLSLSNIVTIISGILVFLPILIFTFRTTFAPKPLILIDVMGVSLIIVYGGLLVLEIWIRTTRKEIDRETI